MAKLSQSVQPDFWRNRGRYSKAGIARTMAACAKLEEPEEDDDDRTPDELRWDKDDEVYHRRAEEGGRI